MPTTPQTSKSIPPARLIFKRAQEKRVKDQYGLYKGQKLRWATYNDYLRKKICSDKRKRWDSFQAPPDKYDDEEELIEDVEAGTDEIVLNDESAHHKDGDEIETDEADQTDGSDEADEEEVEEGNLDEGEGEADEEGGEDEEEEIEDEEEEREDEEEDLEEIKGDDEE